MRQSIHFWKAFFELYNFDFYENVRNRKFIADNFSLKGLKNKNFQTAIVCYKFSISNVFVEIEVVELGKIFPKMYGCIPVIVYRFRDKRKKLPTANNLKRT